MAPPCKAPCVQLKCQSQPKGAKISCLKGEGVSTWGPLILVLLRLRGHHVFVRGTNESWVAPKEILEGSSLWVSPSSPDPVSVWGGLNLASTLVCVPC